MLLRNRFPSHPMYGFDDQTRSNLHDESKRAEERYRDALLNKLRPSYTPSEMVRIVQRSQGLIPGGIASEEGAGTMAPETDWEKLQKISNNNKVFFRHFENWFDSLRIMKFLKNFNT